MSDILTDKIEKEIDYLAHEIVVPITGNPTTEYERNAIRKYKRDLRLFVDKLRSLGWKSPEELKVRNEAILIKAIENEIIFGLENKMHVDNIALMIVDMLSEKLPSYGYVKLPPDAEEKR